MNDVSDEIPASEVDPHWHSSCHKLPLSRDDIRNSVPSLRGMGSRLPGLQHLKEFYCPYTVSALEGTRHVVAQCMDLVPASLTSSSVTYFSALVRLVYMGDLCPP